VLAAHPRIIEFGWAKAENGSLDGPNWQFARDTLILLKRQVLPPSES
jgi:hypothetical protein